MRVAFNALYLLEPYTGTGRYVTNLLSALGRVDGINEYLVLSPTEVKNVPETPSTFQWEALPPSRFRHAGESVARLAWEQHTFPHAAKQRGARLMHVPYFAPPRRTLGIPIIATIHDIINLRLPAYRATPTAQAYARLVSNAAKHADMIIAVSEFSKRDIMETLGMPEDRVRVIYEAVAPQYRRVQDARRLIEVREKYGLSDMFVLNVGGLDARKNIQALVGAFAAVFHEMQNPDLQLFIAGDPDRLGSSPLFPDWRYLATAFEVEENVVCMPIDEEDLPAMYSAASCFAFTSVYEGFGLTPLEAMACGAPVVCSNRTSLPEVVGSAGVQVDPLDTDRLGGAILRVLTSREHRDDLRARGLAHVREFSWQQAAAETSALYAEVTGTTRD
ncbi:MAG TPA: glycosyltransferase family 1 protein [Ktedonobacterales bacterium]